MKQFRKYMVVFPPNFLVNPLNLAKFTRNLEGQS
jgi:hypothetical protein